MLGKMTQSQLTELMFKEAFTRLVEKGFSAKELYTMSAKGLHSSYLECPQEGIFFGGCPDFSGFPDLPECLELVYACNSSGDIVFTFLGHRYQDNLSRNELICSRYLVAKALLSWVSLLPFVNAYPYYDKRTYGGVKRGCIPSQVEGEHMKQNFIAGYEDKDKGLHIWNQINKHLSIAHSLTTHAVD